VRTGDLGRLVAGLPGWSSLTCVVFHRCAVLYGQNQATLGWLGSTGAMAGPTAQRSQTYLLCLLTSR
jgi:hypothetical protein